MKKENLKKLLLEIIERYTNGTQLQELFIGIEEPSLSKRTLQRYIKELILEGFLTA